MLSFLILIFLPNYGYGQEEFAKIIHGKIVATAADLEGIYVVNLKTDLTRNTLSKRLKYLSIMWKDLSIILSKIKDL